MTDNIRNLKSKLFAEITSTPSSLSSSRFKGLNGLRGISILFVLLGHLSMNSYLSAYFSGSIGVWIFFVISGFLITTLLIKEKLQTGKISLKQFYIRRLLRIIPVAYLFLLTLALVNHALALNVPLRSFISAGLFVQNIPRLSNYNWYIQHFWSLSVEEQFYLTFPFLLVYNLNWYIRICIGLIILIPVVEYLGFNNIGVFYSNRELHLVTFTLINIFGNLVFIAIGSLASILFFKGIIIPKDTGFLRWLSLPLFILAIAVTTARSPIFIPYAQLLLFPSLIATVIILNLNENSILTIILNNKLLNYLGTLSYSIYIWQQLFSNPQTWLIKVNSLSLHLLLILMLAMMSYHLYEKPFLNLKNKFKALAEKR